MVYKLKYNKWHNPKLKYITVYDNDTMMNAKYNIKWNIFSDVSL